MAKKRSIMPEELEPADGETVNTPQSEADAPVFRNASSKLNLTTKAGQRKLLTYTEAMMPHNYQQLSEKSKRILSQGKTASQLVREIRNKHL